MGPRVMRRLPKFVHGFIDRHGKPRFYFRRAGFRKVPLPGLPWSPEFMAAYQDAREGAPRVEVGAARSGPGTVAAAVASYFDSAVFATGLAESTRRTRRRILERFRNEHGDKGIATLGKIHVERMVNAKAGTPGEALNFLVALRALMRHAVTAGLRVDDPTIGVRSPKYRSAGFYTWTEADIGAFEATHPKGTQARLALALLLTASGRGADGAAAHPRRPAKRDAGQDRHRAGNPPAPGATGGIRRDAGGEHDVPRHPWRKTIPSGCVLTLV
jgi:hypothetical protein